MAITEVRPPVQGRKERRSPRIEASSGLAERILREAEYRRLLRLSAAISLLFHVLVIAVLIVRQLGIGAMQYAPRVEPAPPPPEGIHVIDVRVLPRGQSPSNPEEPAPARKPAETVRQVPGPVPVTRRPAAARVGRAMTNAEKLQPREGDPRLWRNFHDRPLPARRLRLVERADSAVRAILQARLDSLNLSEEQRRRAVEWLLGKGDQKWGITPEGLRLGNITIPLALGKLFQEEGPNGREARLRARDLAQIADQDRRTDADAVRKERGAAIRKRTDEELEQRRKKGQEPVPAATADSVKPPPRT